MTARLAFDCLRDFHGDGLATGRDAGLRRLVMLNLHQPRIVAALTARWLVDHPLSPAVERVVFGYLKASTLGDSRMLVQAVADLARTHRQPDAPSLLEQRDADPGVLNTAVEAALSVMLAPPGKNPDAVTPPAGPEDL